MLVLTRKIGETIIINENIQLTVLAVEGEAVKIGVQAPKDVKVYRQEVYLEIQKANQEAARYANVDTMEWKRLLEEDKDTNK